ncbi:MAG: segregation/condensation protein A [Clostridiaceae bacterium]|nr:segregation/condensation protein A [Clostridiaceae bacterium]
MNYTIKIEAFEGPFDLLFHLIEKNELDIYDIPINEITEQYLKYIYKMEKLDLNITSEFLVMAATLIEIKSKMLLPKDSSEGKVQEKEEQDPRSDLVRKLLEYKKYKAVAQELKTKGEHYSRTYFKPKEEIIISHDKDNESIEDMQADDLLKVLSQILLNKYKSNTDVLNSHVRHIERETITIEDKSKEIITKLQETEQISFYDLFQNLEDKTAIIVTFLALLELLKMKKVTVVQSLCFSDITIEYRHLK